MGIKCVIGGREFQAESYTVREEATPISAGDTAGSVGTIQLTIPRVDEDIHPDSDLDVIGPMVLVGQSVELRDSRKGYTLGEVTGATYDEGSALYQVSCRTRLGDLLVANARALPYTGTLSGAVAYYLSLAGVDTEYIVDDEIADRPVTFTGWNGDVWRHLKQLAAAQDCDVSLVSGLILVRPLRKREAIQGRDVSRSRDTQTPSLARRIQVYQYNNEPFEGEMVYPPQRWLSETQIFNVDAGGVAEYILDLDSSLTGVVQPQHVTNVPNTVTTTGVYTVMSDTGEMISPQRWSEAGGSVRVTVGEDTKSLVLRLVAPAGMIDSAQTPIKNFSLAQSVEELDGELTYSTLRVFGDGVRFRKELRDIPTSVPEEKVTTDIGVTIDNPFFSTTDDVYRAGTRAARYYAGVVPSLTGEVSAINRLGDSGTEDFASYGDIQSFLPSTTYAGVEDYYSSQGLTTYGSVLTYWRDVFRNDDANQVFGNVQGTRVYDRKTHRWYRIRSGDITPGLIRFEADDDLTHGDMEPLFAGLTYAGVQAQFYPNMNYAIAELRGMYSG